MTKENKKNMKWWHFAVIGLGVALMIGVFIDEINVSETQIKDIDCDTGANVELVQTTPVVGGANYSFRIDASGLYDYTEFNVHVEWQFFDGNDQTTDFGYQKLSKKTKPSKTLLGPPPARVEYIFVTTTGTREDGAECSTTTTVFSR